MTRYRIEYADTGELAVYARGLRDAARQLAVTENRIRRALDETGYCEIDGFAVAPCPGRVAERQSRAHH